MTTGQPVPGFGTAYYPESDLQPNGSAVAPQLGRLRGLPRRRRPAMIALSVALVGAGILVSAGLYQRANHQVPVVLVTAAVPAGTAITAADVGTTTVAAGPGIEVIPGSQLQQVIGEIAATSLRPGTLLAASELTTLQPPALGQVLVPVPIKPSELPASGLFPGDHVLVVATPGAGGGSGAGAAPVLTHPVAGLVQQVSNVPDQDGLDVVDLLVPASAGTAVAQQAATGQIALIVTKRSP
ncbi:MAG TPA: SAF domain-containing protein [Streptosporangiaceae bacterium]|nr:SAF domain-containing protein [Streptosporangiaceae bacterium]